MPLPALLPQCIREKTERMDGVINREEKGREKGYISYPVDLCPLLGPE